MARDIVLARRASLGISKSCADLSSASLSHFGTVIWVMCRAEAPGHFLRARRKNLW